MAIIKYKNHPRIKAITDRMEKLGKPTFNFKFTSHEETEKEVNNLKIKKASQKSDIPLKIIKENVDIISYFLYHNFNNSLSCATFPILYMLTSYQSIKKIIKLTKRTTAQ